MLVKKGKACGGRPVAFIRQVYLHAPNELVFCDPIALQWLPMKSAILRMMLSTNKMMELMETIMKPKAAEFVKKISSYKEQKIDVKKDLKEFIIKISIVLIAGKMLKDEDAIVKGMKHLNALILACL